MPRYTNVDRFKVHLNIDYTEEREEEYLSFLLEASEQRIELEINQPLDTFVDEDGNLNSALVSAILLHAGNLYNNRESVSMSTDPKHIPFTFGYMIQPFKKYESWEFE